jgi:rod shape-determining protein MreC
MNFRKDRTWQSIALGLFVIGLLFMAIAGYLNPLLELVLDPVLGVQSWITIRYQAFQDLVNSPADITRLRQRNAELESENASLQTQIIALQQQVTEVQLLSALLDFARSQRENDYVTANVVYQDPRPFLKFVIIDVGSDQGLLRGMPVVGAEGLVGRVDAVTASAARVQLITDPLASVSVVIQPSDTTAVLTGSVTSDIRLSMISQEAEVQPGDLILTSGLGGNYPANILIGQVASVRGTATDLFQEAVVQPVIDFNRLDIVLVIVDFQPVDIGPLIPEGE